MQPVGHGGREEVVLFQKGRSRVCTAPHTVPGPASSGSTARTLSGAVDFDNVAV